ncbi:NAD-dependent epimerase/dehydratase family protein [Nakamurella endophytica]|uniref:UDP-glucose 4-epimerase n=1 Tax=Nakamurella endophytica TaxID=1748367 RepID=A0A917WFA0_9ACTN|nr:NAD(P)-dependent oxidoreductase [Nakamurella endophytica]GGM00275.1 UDP-glucose 4-epimerase [Nakamurella endophytica]
MARIAVTGGSGKLGSAVVRDLVDHGHDVVNLDRAPSPDAVAPFVRVDLTDYGQAAQALQAVDDRYDRIDAVVHLAAIPAPGLTTNAATFGNNILATYHVFSAARAAGIRRVVWASSETVLGLPLGPDAPPPYLPVDEEYHPRPNSSYSLAKTLEEEMALQFCRWEPGMTMIGLRFSNVMAPGDYAAFPGYDADPAVRQWNAWGYIDARDGAQAVRLALTADLTGRHVFVIANADTVMSRPSAELAAEAFPGVEVRRELGEHETLLGIDKARRLLGYEPAHSWRDHAG